MKKKTSGNRSHFARTHLTVTIGSNPSAWHNYIPTYMHLFVIRTHACSRTVSPSHSHVYIHVFMQSRVDVSFVFSTGCVDGQGCARGGGGGSCASQGGRGMLRSSCECVGRAGNSCMPASRLCGIVLVCIFYIFVCQDGACVNSPDRSQGGQLCFNVLTDSCGAWQ